jgi:hypothetical protein
MTLVGAETVSQMVAAQKWLGQRTITLRLEVPRSAKAETNHGFVVVAEN